MMKRIKRKNRDRIISYLRIREKGEIPEVSSEELCDVYADKSENILHVLTERVI